MGVLARSRVRRGVLRFKIRPSSIVLLSVSSPCSFSDGACVHTDVVPEMVRLRGS